MFTRVAHARTFLFVPGHRADRFDKAIASGADAIVIDLEDSVPSVAKAEARASIEREWTRLRAMSVPVLVRINGTNTDAGQQDLVWLERLAAAAAVVLSKSESPQQIISVHRRANGAPVLPIIESATGYAALSALADTPGVVRLAIGHLDFMADTGMRCDDDQSELAPLRFAVAMATRLSRLAPAVDGVTEQIHDEARLRQDVGRAMRFGMGGKLCIHPAQVNIVHQAMAPTERELQWAREVIAAEAAANGAAVQVGGRMVDLPVVLRARQVLARSGRGSD
jgi:citrate lyase subunit beta/citryl-CoA lyase